MTRRPPAPIRCLGIAHRGEAATRCLRTVKALRAREGSPLRAVVLYTEAERDALFVRHADLAVELPAAPGREAEAYLDGPRVISALRSGGADAVWPGWGFLSEDPGFADAAALAGLRFLGPPADVLRRIGDKIAAKQLVESIGAPVVPWSGEALETVEAAREAAARLGLPAVLKAAAGGGGRGIRTVRDAHALPDAFRAAAHEARAAFGDGRLFLERCVEGARHIEVQIAADAHGHVRALGLRDCSVQRRHQKLIEEAPPARLPVGLQRQLEQVAVDLARQVGYVGVGTVEFLVRGKEFLFLEVNPRLQVEHGVTEVTSGVDLVELQIRIARGESLAGLRTRPRGAAIEVRLCAEDPTAGCAPAPGRLVRFDPAWGPGIRIDTGLAAGNEVPAAFDSLVAKLIAGGRDRPEALARLRAALTDLEVVIHGGATNKGLLLSVLESDAFRRAAFDTGWLDRFTGRAGDEDALGPEALTAAAILAYQRNREAARLNFLSDRSGGDPSAVPPSVGQRIDLAHRGRAYRIHVFAIGSWRYRLHLDEQVTSATLREESAHRACLHIEGRVYRILHDATETGLRVEVEGQPHWFGWESAGQVRAASPGMVVAVHARVGDRVSAGDPLGVLEAMKTEIAFHAPIGGVVREVRVGRGAQVAAGDVLVVIEAGDREPAKTGGAVRLTLPRSSDPLALLVSTEGPDGGLEVRLRDADAASPGARRAALEAAREEIRRILLGYDLHEARGEHLLAFLEAPLPEAISEGFRWELAEVRSELVAFADVEQLFVRAPHASASGVDGPSNYARLRTYVRRLRAEGAGIAPEFLASVRQALAHYGLHGLEPSDALERAVLRLLATQRTPTLRRRLALGLVRRLASLARGGVHLGEDRALADALTRIAAMRGLVPDALADVALEARYEIFESPAIAREAERTSKAVEAWLPLAESGSVPPPADVLMQLASAPLAVFDRIARLVDHDDPRRRMIALAAHLQRLYLTCTPLRRTGGGIGETTVERAELEDGRILLGASCRGPRIEPTLATLERMVEAEASVTGRRGVDCLELLVPDVGREDRAGLRHAAAGWLTRTRAAARLTLTLLGGSGAEDWHETFEVAEATIRRRPDLHGVHPETAARIDLQRLRTFALERLPGGEDLYCFRGRHRESAADERLFVLAEVRGMAGEGGGAAAFHQPAFERAFFEATRRLRAFLGVHDPARRLQWNRLMLFVVPEVALDPAVAEELARTLHPETRHLGLEKVVVHLKVRDPNHPGRSTRPTEIVIADPTGSRMELSWREPRTAPLGIASLMERRLAESRRRGLLYPYELLRLVTGRANGSQPPEAGAGLAAPGRFEEWDLDPEAPAPRPVCVAGRPLGHNTCSVVFGLLTTPTEKVPEGVRRVIVLSDPTQGLGSLGAAECDRIVAAIDLAEELGLPVEWIPVSSGARISMESGTENLDATARVVRRIVTFTEAGGVIHVVVHGVNVGAQSYFDALATMGIDGRGALVMVGGGSMVLTGRAALEASGSVAGEDEAAIGGYERVMGPNGEAHYYAHDFLDAHRVLAEHYRYTYVVPGEAGPRPYPTRDPAERDVTAERYSEEDGLGFATIGEIFDDRTNPGRKRPFSMRALMRALVDRDGGWLERWKDWAGAEMAIVWDAHLGGHAVCLIGVESRNLPREGYRPPDGPATWSGGTLFPLSSKKVARALRAASGNRPVVLLANLSGFDGSPESMRKLQLEYGAEIARAVVGFEGPILFLVVSRYHGGAYVVFSRELNPGLRAAALEGSYASVIGGAAAAKVVFGREVRARAAADPRLAELRSELGARSSVEARERLERVQQQVMQEKEAEIAEQFDAVHTVARARQVGSLEDIIAPQRMRPYLVGLLQAARG